MQTETHKKKVLPDIIFPFLQGSREVFFFFFWSLFAFFFHQFPGKTGNKKKSAAIEIMRALRVFLSFPFVLTLIIYIKCTIFHPHKKIDF